MKRWLFITMMACMALVFCGCRDQWPYYHSYKSVDRERWFSGDKVELSVPPLSADTVLRIAVCLRATQDYPYQHLALNMTVRDDSTHQTVKRLVLKVPVFDEEGLAIGKGFPFMEAEYEVADEHLTMRKDHAYTITFRHDMRATTIHGISDIGVKLY